MATIWWSKFDLQIVVTVRVTPVLWISIFDECSEWCRPWALTYFWHVRRDRSISSDHIFHRSIALLNTVANGYQRAETTWKPSWVRQNRSLLSVTRGTVTAVPTLTFEKPWWGVRLWNANVTTWKPSWVRQNRSLLSVTWGTVTAVPTLTFEKPWWWGVRLYRMIPQVMTLARLENEVFNMYINQGKSLASRRRKHTRWQDNVLS
jgi:hypothetical protein